METENNPQLGINNAMLQIMAGIDPIAKNKTNSQQNYKYRGVEDIYAVLNPMLIANKVLLIPEILHHDIKEFTSSKGSLLFRAIVTMKYIFKSVEDGSFIETIMTGEGMDSGDKATPKAVSMAFKYMAFQLFCIPIDENVNAEADNHEVKAEAEKPSQSTDKKAEPEKWLNSKDKAGNITPEWTNLMKGISDAKINTLADVRKYYKVSKSVAIEVEGALGL
jgi:hypothetical protein